MSIHPLFSPRRRTAVTPVAAVADDGGVAPDPVVPAAGSGAPTPCSVRFHAESGVVVVDAYHCTWVCDTRGDGLWYVSPWAQPEQRDLVRSVDSLCWLNAEAATVVRALCTGRHLQAVR